MRFVVTGLFRIPSIFPNMFHLKYYFFVMDRSSLLTNFFFLPGSCPQGWIGHGGSCYLPYVHGLTWQEANETCREMDAHLALSKSVTENEFIAVEVARPESRVWIGLRRNEGEFVWSDGSKSEFTNWARFEPKDASVRGRDCVSLLPEDIFYSWEVRNCDERQAFICERGKMTSLFYSVEIQTSSQFTTHDVHLRNCDLFD